MRVASLTLRAAALQPLGRAQASIADAQTEMATGRLADPGQALGARSERRAALDGAIAEARSAREALGPERSRMKAVQDALGGMGGVADDLVATLATALGAPTRSTLRLAAEAADGQRATVIGHANARLGAVHLFGGTRTDDPPLADPASSAAARDWVRDAFVARFGHPPDDPASATIGGAAMESFLADAEADFATSGFQTAWAGAAPDTRTVRLGADQNTVVPVTHHEPAIRDLILASSLAAELADAPLAAPARNSVLEHALGVAGRAQAGMAEAAGRVGLAQERVGRAEEAATARLRVAETALDGLIGVDGIDAAARVAALAASIEASLTVTARIERLSLVNYL